VAKNRKKHRFLACLEILNQATASVKPKTGEEWVKNSAASSENPKERV